MVLYAFLEKSGTLKSLASRMDPSSEMKIKNVRLFFDKVKGFSDLADDDSLYLTWARDYGLKRLKKVSPFVLEALDIPGMPEEVLRSSALEEIRRFSLRQEAGALSLRKPRGTLILSFLRLEDYLTCPLKYRFRHILRIPVLSHHALVFGRVLHASVHHFLKNRRISSVSTKGSG